MAPTATERTRMGTLALAACLLLVALAGCSRSVPTPQPAPPTPVSPSPLPPALPSPPPSAPPRFDGEAALQFVRGLALNSSGAPRFRMPGTVGQTEGAAYLWTAANVPGWTRNWQNFTGADYLALDRTMVENYGPGSPYCHEEDAKALPGWPFHNLYAVHSSGRAGAPLLLIGAHWDSQMASDMDPDLSKRKMPDPGANDGASGVGVLLQLMRELQTASLAFDVGVFFVDGEDGFYNCYPIAGALMFTQHPPVKVGRFILLDMVGDPGAKYAKESQSLQSDGKMVDLLWRHGRTTAAARAFLNETSSISDDHIAFIQAGIPSVDLIDAGRKDTLYGFPPQWDTTFDTVDRLDAKMLDAVGSTLVATLTDPELASSWPVPTM